MKPPHYRIVPERNEIYVGTKEVHLTPKEYRLLLALAESGRTMSRAELMGRVWPADTEADPRVIDQNVLRIRRKIKVPVILTVNGFGYKAA